VAPSGIRRQGSGGGVTGAATRAPGRVQGLLDRASVA